MRSNKALRPLVKFFPAGLALALVCLGGCSRPVDVHSGSVRGVGYVRVEDVVKKHPLYGQLAQIDSNIDALNMRALAPSVPKTGAEIARQTTELNHELQLAQTRANAQLQQKQADYSAREQAAIRAALVAAGENPGAAPAQAMQNTAALQAANVSAQANSDFAQYQQAVVAQDRTAVDAVSKALDARAQSQYRQKADELQSKESAASLDLATRDSSQRISLRTKLSNLALDDTLRAQVKAQLSALDRKEAAATTAMRDRDAATLKAFQAQLRTQTSGEIAKQAQSIHQQTQSKLKTRHDSVSSKVNSQLQSLGGAAPSNNGRISPAMQGKIAQIDKQYKAQFKAEVAKAIANFNKTRSDLDLRFAALRGVDVGAQGALGKQLAALHHQRDQLYGQIMAQIKREVQTIAAQRGLKVVFINVVQPVGGIDLTEAAQKDVESLHE
ncbi:MAG: hypothetical protein M3126_07745 [Candidatus Eremiobacteraeota bacterium]|nr:hypothetical protein [Candidatus Eremiobacteraeota bacterium]